MNLQNRKETSMSSCYVVGRQESENQFKLFWTTPVTSFLDAVEYVKMFAFENKGTKFVVVDIGEGECDVVYSCEV